MTHDFEALAKLVPPATLRLADGTDVPHAIGTRVYNYYDGEVGEIVGLATRAQPDTSGLLPDGAAWWIDFRADSAKRTGYTTSLDGSRMCSIEHAKRRGWL